MAKHHQEPNSATPEQHDVGSPEFLCDALYCSEDVGEDCFQEEQGESGWDYENKRNCFPFLVEHKSSCDDEELSYLFTKEKETQPFENIETNPYFVGARRGAVEWMLKVNAHYSFTALTAILAVNYLDRFLVGVRLHTDKPWMIQLAAVACLSLAAKVEATQVFLLLDLQVEDSKYVFEAKTIQRMEIMVLSSLQWRMHPVTALSFLDYMTRRLGLKDYLCCEFLRRCESIVLSVISDSRTTQYAPSIMAIATMLHVTNGIEPSLEAEYRNQLLGLLRIDKDKVEDCRELIIDLVSRGHSCHSRKRNICSIPGSPNGVMEMSFSSDSSNNTWAVASSASPSPEPLSKKSRTLCNLSDEASDFSNISR